MTAKRIRYLAALLASVCVTSVAPAQVLAPNPTPEMYVANNKGGSRIIPNGQLSFDGQSFTCGRFPTVEDPLLSDYAAAPYKGFLIINPTVFNKVPTTVKLWIYQHECAHAKWNPLFGVKGVEGPAGEEFGQKFVPSTGELQVLPLGSVNCCSANAGL